MIFALLASQITGILVSAHLGLRFAAACSLLISALSALVIRKSRPRHDFLVIVTFCALVLSCYILGTFSVVALDISAYGSVAGLAGRTVPMKGEVHWVYEGGYGRQISLGGIEIAGTGKLKGKVLIEAASSDLDSLEEVEPGDILSGKVEVSLINGSMNPGGFDARAYWALKGVCAKASQLGAMTVQQGRPPMLTLFAWKLYKAFKDFTTRALPSEDEKAMLDAIVLSDKSSMDPAVKEAFSEGGIAHVMSASGLHVSIVIGSISWIMTRLGAKPQHQFAVLLVILPIYAIAAGLRPSIIRALIMGLMALSFRLIKVKDPGMLVKLAMAGILQLALSPASLFDKGFLLSYAAIIGVWIYSLLQPAADGKGIIGRSAAFLSKGLAASFIITAVTLPITATFYGSISLLGPLANLVAIPAASGALMVGLAAFVVNSAWPWLGAILLQLSRPLLHALIKTAQLVGSLDFFSLRSGYGPSAQTALYYAVLALGLAAFMGALSFRRMVKLAVKRHVVPIVLTSIILLSIIQTPERMVIDIFAVGQGDSALVSCGDGFNLLIDTGPAYKGNSAVQDKILPALCYSGISRIDVLMLTHGHSDHVSGLDELAMSMPIGATIVPTGDIDAARSASAAGLEPLGSTAGTVIAYKDLRVELLNPAEPVVYCDDLNEKSIVVSAVFQSAEVLLQADAGAEFEGAYKGGTVDALKVGHHGSRTASGVKFLSTISPRIAVVSVGKNVYGHPSAEAMERLESACDLTLRTDVVGMVRIVSTRDGVEAMPIEEAWMSRPFFRALRQGSYNVWN